MLKSITTTATTTTATTTTGSKTLVSKLLSPEPQNLTFCASIISYLGTLLRRHNWMHFAKGHIVLLH